ncbi:hypothetical protein IFM89_035451 [Coptis chinensis]|uniref:Uncharacterized protein n=1 Tax=Coptis chinensis TaxID=261450 RepID=A0A835IYR6_9MAGN|nr:hypothetical protein IFM89_035451 [Coptis chinensis]
MFLPSAMIPEDIDLDVKHITLYEGTNFRISLVVNPSWTNPTGEWHVGCKLVYELFTSSLTSHLKKERKKKWDEKKQEAIAEAVKNLDLFDQNKCDLINMSYEEPAMLPDYGRFVDLMN